MNKVGRSNPVGAGSVRKSRGEVVESKRLNGSMAHKEVKNGIEEQKLSANDNDDDIIEVSTLSCINDSYVLCDYAHDTVGYGTLYIF
ncbi:hypothetical protein DPMN_182919 [Dreissena polymorpha]|uniref:Uncharacterized protein n=1 Tax=Dreissena polymorpha TaxID=45954 RepID=A0A9D4DGE8_DREPO|nr:hypothetical protein DPMN_182919 [Dreissena polymorpha]